MTSGGRPAGRSAIGRPPAGRVLDLLALALVLPLLLVPALLIALAVFLDSPGSVLYRARRIGQGGKPFLMLKFRTMRAGSAGPSLAGAADERVTPLGRFLRSSRMDELPQVWNVLRGEMRLVGPRPELEEFVSRYPREYDEILTVAPGITGSTQLRFVAEETNMMRGRPDPGRHYAEQVLPRKVRLDLSYVRTHRVLGDVRLLLQTVLLPMRLAVVRIASLVRRERDQVPAYLLSAGVLVLLVLAFLTASGSAR